MDDGNSVTTKLLTLLNVSATKIGKRKRFEDDFVPSEKLNKRKSISFSETKTTPEKADIVKETSTVEKETVETAKGVEDEDMDLEGMCIQSIFVPKFE